MRDNQMICGVDGDLNVVADNTGAAPARRHRASPTPEYERSAYRLNDGTMKGVILHDRGD
jgi:hypothetical protein